MDCKYKVNIKNIQYNYKIRLAELQEKYKFNLFCTGGKYDDTEIREEIASLEEENEYLNSIVDQLPKVKVEGEYPTLDNTLQAKMKVDLKGNTSQYTTNGNQLVNFGDLTIQSNSVVYTFTNDLFIEKANGSSYNHSYFSILDSVKNNAGKTIKFGYNSVDLSNFTGGTTTIVQLVITNNGSTTYKELAKYSNATTLTLDTYTIPNDTSGITKAQIQIFANNSSTVNNTSEIKITKPLIYYDNNNQYEPYTGGQPAPSPDYPFPIHVVSGNNSIKVRSTNVYQGLYKGGYLNSSGVYSDSAGYRTIYASVKPNTKYYINKPLTTRCIIGCSTNVISLGTQTTNVYRDDSATHIEYTTDPTANYINIYCYASSGESITFEELQNNLFITENEATYPINLESMELAYIPDTDYQDRIFKATEGDTFYDTLDSTTKNSLDTGSWYKYGAIYKKTLVGNENWSYQSEHPRFVLNLSPRPVNNAMCYAPIYIKGQTSSAGSNNTISVASGSGYSQLLVHDERFTTKGAYNTWLSSNNVDIYYPLETPTYTKITDTTLISQLEALKEAESYLGQTNISQVNNDAPFIINASALYDLNNLITRVAILETE